MREPFRPYVERHYGPDPVLVACGLPATNKSWSMEMVAELKGYPVLRTDEIRRELMRREDVFQEAVASSMAQRRRVYQEMFRRAEEAAAGGGGVILDATFVTRALRREAARVAASHHRRLIIQEMVTSPEYSLGIIAARTPDSSESNAVTAEAYFNNKEAFEPVDLDDLQDRFPDLAVLHLIVDADSDEPEDWFVVHEEMRSPP
jgi:predicted kinase